jgi:murein DD-endopeptidase MepM/ murein hydrolase activator NlpD
MAIMMFSAGALADSGLRTIRTRTLVALAAALALAVLLSGLAIGFQIGRVADAGDRSAGGPPGYLGLDPSRPGDQALVDEIGALSGRLIRLEAEASRLAERVDASSKGQGPKQDSAKSTEDASRPAGGPLLASRFDAAPGAGISLVSLDRQLGELEAALGRVGAELSRRDLDAMAFPSRVPVPGVPVSSGFGRRTDPFTGLPALHTGIDYPAPYGTPILASAGGRVRYAGPRGPYGKTVEIDHGGGLVTRYGHASRILVRVGDILLPGQNIAAVGSTGRSTGPHLHFEVLREGVPVHPESYLVVNEPP